MKSLLIAREVDCLFRWPRGRALKLAAAGKLPHITLPDGQIRFDEEEIGKLLTSSPSSQNAEVAIA